MPNVSGDWNGSKISLIPQTKMSRIQLLMRIKKNFLFIAVALVFQVSLEKLFGVPRERVEITYLMKSYHSRHIFS